MSISKHELQSTDEVIALLPDELAEFMPPERLFKNETRLLASLPECDPTVLEAVRKTLSEAPLIHESPAYIKHRDTIRPHRYLGKAEFDIDNESIFDALGMTFRFDESLGLDKCVFLAWPTQERSSTYGRNIYLLETSLLFQENCFVTLYDIREISMYEELPDFITEITFNEVDEEVYGGTYQQLRRYISGEETLETRSEPSSDDASMNAVRYLDGLMERMYFDTMVSGKVWFEYVARHIASGGSIDDLATAEVKIYGSIPTTKIVAHEASENLSSEYIHQLNLQIAASTRRVTGCSSAINRQQS